MKKIFLLLVLSFALQNIFGQKKLHYGVNASFIGSISNVNKIISNNPLQIKGILDYGLGMNLLYSINSTLQIKSGLDFVNKGYILYSKSPEGGIHIRASYLELPLKLRAKTTKQQFVELGTSAGFVLDASTHAGQTHTKGIKSLNPTCFGISGGYSWRVNLSSKSFCEFSAIGNWNLSEFWNAKSTNSSLKLQNLSLQLAYYFNK